MRQNRLRRLSLLLACCLCLGAGNGIAQTGNITPGGMLDKVFDQYGHQYHLADLAIGNKMPVAGPPAGGAQGRLVVPSCSSGYFQLYLDSACGLDNYATDTTEMNRLLVVCQVLNDLSAFINSPIGASPTGQKVNVWVRPFSSINAPVGTLGVASSFYNVPETGTASGIVDNATWITLHSGTDAFANVTTPLVTVGGSTNNFFHCYMAFDFTQPWNLSLPTGPSASKVDYYTVVLHEMLHALGFNSLIDSNGQSIMGANNKYFTRYDMNLKNSAGVPLISQIPGSCGMYGYNFSANLTDLQPDPSHPIADFTNCPVAIKYWGSLATPQPVYTPNIWTAGSSLSHMEDMCAPINNNNLYFLMSNAQPLGAAKRYPKPEERQILCDIGYNCNTQFGSSSNASFNYNYGGTACPGINVAGINDGIVNGLYLWTCIPGGSVTIPGSAILGNDHGATNYQCAEAVPLLSQGTVTGASGSASSNITFTASATASGVQMLRYIPVSATGQMGNITYIYVFVNNTTSCTYTSCNLVPNGDFESAQNCGPINFGVNTPPPVLNCWQPVGTPDLFSEGCAAGQTLTGWNYDIPTSATVYPNYNYPTSQHVGTTAANNQHFVGLWGSRNNPNLSVVEGEGIQVQLGAALIPGNTYTLSFWATVANTNGLGAGLVYLPSTLTFSGAQSLIANVTASGVTNLASFIIPVTNTPVPAINGIDQNWGYFTQSFTYTGTANANYFLVYNNIGNIISGVQYPSSGIYGTYVFIDDIKLEATTQAPVFTPPASVSTCSTPVTNLGQYLAPYVAGGTFSGPGVNNATQTFDPASAGAPGTKYINYTYTSNLGCTEIATGTIQLQSPLTITSAKDLVCPGQTDTLTATGCSNCVWAPATVSCQNAGCSIVTATQSATTTYSVHDAATPACTASDTVNEFTATIISNFANNTCTNYSTNLFTSPSNSSYSYLWYSYANGVPTLVSSIYNYWFSSGTPGNYQVYVVVNNGTCSATSPTQTLAVAAPPTVSVTPSATTACFPSCPQVTANVTPAGSYYYDWYQNGVFIPNMTASTFPACNTGNYSLIVTDPATSCASAPATFSTTITHLTVSARAVISTTGCSTVGVPLMALPGTSTGITYQWYNNGVPVGGPSSSSTLQAYTTGTYTVQITDANGCGGVSNGVPVTIYDAPTATIAATTTCTSQTYTATVAPTGTYNYQWINSSIIPNANSTTYTASSPGNYWVQVTNPADNCVFNSNVIAYSTATPPPVITITATGSVCGGGNVTLSATTGYTYQWRNSAGNIPGATGMQYTTSTPGVYTVVLSTGGCSTTSLPITESNTPVPVPATITPAGTTAICAGSTATLTASPATGYTYNWQQNTGTGYTTLAATTGSISASMAGQYRVIITNAASCTDTSAAATITVTPAPTATITYTGSPTFCTGGNLTMTASTGMGYTYQWKLNGTNIPAATSGTYTATAAGSYTVTVSVASCTATSAPVVVTINAAPVAAIVTAGPITLCGGNSVLLDAQTGAGYRYQWLKNGVAITGDTSSAIAVGTGSAGSYTVRVSSSACAGTVTSAALIVNEVNTTGTSCAPCSVFGNNTFGLIDGSTISSWPMTGVNNSGPYYFVSASSATVTNSITINNACIMFTANATLNVAPGATLTLNNCHLFGCPSNMWNGIVLQTNTTTNGNIVLNNCLVEDATEAVEAYNPKTQGGNIISSNGTVFNRNTYGMFIDDYFSNTAATYPFSVINTVFTSRAGIATAMNAWTGAATLRAAVSTPTAYDVPFFLCNNFAPAVLKNGGDAQIGIDVVDVGVSNIPLSGAPTYYEMVIGAGATAPTNAYQNLFDNLHVGVLGDVANITLVNNAFANMHGTGNEDGDGVYMGASTLSLHNRLRMYTPAGNYGNVFYNCVNAAEAHNIGDFTAKNTSVISNHSMPVNISATGQNGFWITSAYLMNCDIENNGIANVATGISLTTPALTISPLNPQVVIKNNTIAAEPYLTPYTADRYMVTGISLQNAIACIGCYPTTALDIGSNTIADVFNGIEINGLNNLVVRVDTNQVYLRKQGGGFTGDQFGIYAANNRGAYVYGNNVTESDLLTTDNIRGMYFGYADGVAITCNGEQETGRGYEFVGPQTGIQWLANSLRMNTRGLVINGTMGDQGDATHPAQISWNDAWAGNNKQVYTIGLTVPDDSKLWVTGNSSTPTSYPANNDNSAVDPIYTYGGVGGGIYPATGITPIICPAITRFSGGFGGTLNINPLGITVAHNGVVYPVAQSISAWMAQLSLYQDLITDSTLVPNDGTGTYQSFLDNAAGSRYEYVTNVENYLAAGDIASAQTLLKTGPAAMPPTDPDPVTGVQIADYSDADGVVANYKSFYGLYIDYMQSRLTNTDSSTLRTLAGLCPATNGAVIFQARSLYTAVFNNLGSWSDDGCADGGGGLGRATGVAATTLTNASGQHYQLYPNPTDGNIAILQTIADGQPVAAEVWDGEGKMVHKAQLHFNSRVAGMNLQGIVPGLYLLQLRDSAGNNYTLKFVVK